MRLLYKILPATEWRDATQRGRFDGSAVDHRDGFIHLSAAHQVRETAKRHFAGQDGLLLVGFAEETLEHLRWEASRGGDLFPHVHGTIATGLAAEVHPLPIENGMHRFPPGIP